MSIKHRSLVAFLATSLLASAVNSNADGTLNITNNIGSSNPLLALRHNATATDGWDGGTLDISQNPPPFLGNTDIYSVIADALHPRLSRDTRNNTSSTPYVLHSI